MLDALCPGCGKTWKVPVAGKKYPCRVCGGDVVAAAFEEPAVAAAPGSTPPPLPKRRSVVSQFREKHAQNERQDRIRAAANWLLWLGVIFIMVGGYACYTAKKDADKALLLLSAYGADEMFEVPGRGAVRVSALRDEVKFEALRIWVIHGVLAAAFIGLSFWARTSPLPAAVTGLCLYLVIQVLNLLADPSTLVKGIIFKVLFIAAMAKAINSAITERTLMKSARRDPAPESAPAT